MKHKVLFPAFNHIVIILEDFQSRADDCIFQFLIIFLVWFSLTQPILLDHPIGQIRLIPDHPSCLAAKTLLGQCCQEFCMPPLSLLSQLQSIILFIYVVIFLFYAFIVDLLIPEELRS